MPNNPRCTIKCVHNASQQFEGGKLLNMWGSKTPSEAYATLSKPDVNVTNQSDKDTQLPKMLQLDAKVAKILSNASKGCNA